MTEDRTIAVLGGNGKVGREFVKLALDAGYSVRAFPRDRASFANDGSRSIGHSQIGVGGLRL